MIASDKSSSWWPCVALMSAGVAAITAFGVGGCMSDAKTTTKPETKPAAAAALASSAAPAGELTKDLVVTRVFDAEPELVWSAWTNADHVKRWWGPMTFICPVAEMDVRVGGVSLLCMRAPKEFGGLDYYNTWTYTKVEPHNRLEFVAHFTDKDRTRIEPASIGLPSDLPFEVRQVVTLKPIGKGRTELTVTEFGYTTDQTAELSKMGLNQCLDKMALSFAKP